MNYKLFDSSLDGVVVVDEENRVIYANPLAMQWCGGSVRKFRQKPKFEEVFAFRSAVVEEDIKKITSATAYKEIEFDHQKENGDSELMLMQVSVQPEEESGESKHWIYFIRNNTLETRLRNKYISEQHAKQHFRLAAETDALTGISNKKYFWDKFNESFAVASSAGSTFSLIFFDLDNFKKLNDTYGHFAGDFVLKETASIIESEMLRSGDVFARFGGEEFVVILKRCNIENGLRVAERIRQRIADHKFIYEKHTLSVTIS
ncbi:MAG TPA: diguanylate cyclase, partial [Pseudobdellovibrionaceae bacterium]|nr:diguanylate cyclase [Pseudobdellovibrionaceae bacterium]